MTLSPTTHPAADLGALPRAVERVAPAVVGLSLRRGAASGVVWSPGVVVTAACAVWRARQLHVVLADGELVSGMRHLGRQLVARRFKRPDVAQPQPSRRPCESAASESLRDR